MKYSWRNRKSNQRSSGFSQGFNQLRHRVPHSNSIHGKNCAENKTRRILVAVRCHGSLHPKDSPGVDLWFGVDIDPIRKCEERRRISQHKSWRWRYCYWRDFWQNLLLTSVSPVTEWWIKEDKVTISIRQIQWRAGSGRKHIVSDIFCESWHHRIGSPLLSSSQDLTQSVPYVCCEGLCGTHQILGCKNRTRSLTDYTIHVCELFVLWKIHP
jgi:hypothetical protein